jgi:hypothetical protein
VLQAVRPQAGEQEGWAPQPGLSGLDGLLAQVRATGLTVTARVDGAPADLPSGLDLAAYRIVQEALTNTLKHARRRRPRSTSATARPGSSWRSLMTAGPRRRPASTGPPRDAGSSASTSARPCTAGPVTPGRARAAASGSGSASRCPGTGRHDDPGTAVR